LNVKEGGGDLVLVLPGPFDHLFHLDVHLYLHSSAWERRR
jgi:hypothetical protein